MSDQSHRGARPPSPFPAFTDRRVTAELDAALRASEANPTLPGTGFRGDSVRTATLHLQALNRPGHILFGMVVQAVPYVNWYRVQFGGGQSTVGASLLSSTGFTPLGPREVGGPRPHDLVLCFKPRGLPYAYILGAVPPTVRDGSLSCPDWLVQGGQSGLQREKLHNYVIANFKRSGGVSDHSAGRPLDSTTLEKGIVTSTGGAWSVDDYLIQVRFNEMCGLWLSYFDSWTRLAGLQLLIESGAHTFDAGDDEGESRYYTGVAVYPWEALGLSKPGQTLSEKKTAKEVQYDKPVAARDLPDARRDLMPFHRYREHGGYLGQGHLREVVVPNPADEYFRYGAGGYPIGVFRESIALDGAYSLLSAKSVHIGKRIKIPVAKPRRLPQDKEGDDRDTGNYKFSGQFGGGVEHKIRDLSVDSSLRRPAAFAEIIAYDLNWKAVHPFYYHKADYALPEDSTTTGPFGPNQERLDYGVLAGQSSLPMPEAKRLKIDTRYGDVSYYERESFIRWYDDGSLHIACGAGSEIVLAGGRISFVAPGGLILAAGTDLVLLASQIAIRAHGSLDLSSANKDVRIKAENNLQILAGNSGTGGILLESRGRGAIHNYKNKYGEDVISSGVVLKAANSVCSLLGQDIYLRTGGKVLGSGDIVLDADRGTGRIAMTADTVQSFAATEVAFAIGAQDGNADVTRAYRFTDSRATLDVDVGFRGKLVGYGEDSDIVLSGGLRCIRSISTSGSLSFQQGGPAAKTPEAQRDAIRQQTLPLAQAAQAYLTVAAEQYKAEIDQPYYQPDRLGHEDVISVLEFSFRDPPATPGQQYHTESLEWYEARWQFFSRTGLAQGGKAWTEPPVLVQGAETMPWPGKTKWKTDKIFQQLTQPLLFDPSNGCGVSRAGAYEAGQIGQFQPTTLAEGFLILRE